VKGVEPFTELTKSSLQNLYILSIDNIIRGYIVKNGNAKDEI